jgi:hypothetical protein
MLLTRSEFGAADNNCIGCRRGHVASRQWRLGQLHRQEEHAALLVSFVLYSDVGACLTIMCFSQVIACNLLLVDEVMRAGMTNLSGRE